MKKKPKPKKRARAPEKKQGAVTVSLPSALGKGAPNVAAEELAGSDEDKRLAEQNEAAVARHIDEFFKTKGGRERAVIAFMKAATYVAPYFGLTNFGTIDTPVIEVTDAKVAAEVLCSAGLWLGSRNGIPKDDLAALLDKWAADNGYA